jgi:hypothetical protein
MVCSPLLLIPVRFMDLGMVLQITLHMREGASLPLIFLLNLMVPWERLAGLLMISMNGI